MTDTLYPMNSRANAAKKQHPKQELSERAAIAELVRAAWARGEQITGPEGLLKYLMTTVLETALEIEMNEHLGYDTHSIEGNNLGNPRSGTPSKTVLTDNVEFEGKRGKPNPAISTLWRDAWEHVIPFLDYDSELGHSFLDPQRRRAGKMGHAVQTSPERFRRHLR